MEEEKKNEQKKNEEVKTEEWFFKKYRWYIIATLVAVATLGVGYFLWFKKDSEISDTTETSQDTP